jgi:glycosyltransferase involved in cell wall biosynthesis
VVLFPSLNEGFGLPVAEALASGTPVVTTRHGSTAEIAEGGGALLVDPRDDHDLADAVGRLLEQPDLHAELRRQAAARPQRTWDEYARDLWTVLVASGADRS